MTNAMQTPIALPSVTITVQSSVQGLSMTATGPGIGAVPCPCSFPATPGASYILSTTSPQPTAQGVNGRRYQFVQWSDSTGATYVPMTLTITAPSTWRTYTAWFDTYYLVSTGMLTTGGPPGAIGGSILPPTGWYKSPVRIQASAWGGYQFSGFTGTVNTTANPLDLTLTGSVSETANFTAVQAQPAGIFVTAVPSSQSVGPGGIATSTVMVSTTGAPSGTILLSAWNVPAGTTASFNPSTLPATGGSTTLTFTTSPYSAAATSQITVTATNGSISRSTLFFLTVNPPAAANMLSPAPGSILTTSSATFTWDAGSGATQYTFSLGSSQGASDYYSFLPLVGSLRSAEATYPITEQPTTLYATLNSYIPALGGWRSRYYTYTSNSSPPPAQEQPLSSTHAQAAQPAYFVYNNGVSQIWSYRINAGDAGYIDSGSLALSCANVSAQLGSIPSTGSADRRTFDVKFTATRVARPGPCDLTFKWVGPDGWGGTVTVPLRVTDAVDVYDATPRITQPVQQYDPDYPGGPFYISIYGQYFGRTRGTLTICRSTSLTCDSVPEINVSLDAPWATWTEDPNTGASQINALLTPLPDASGTYDAQVASRGVTGIGFVPAPQGGSSAQSNRQGTVTVTPAPTVKLIQVGWADLGRQHLWKSSTFAERRW